MTEALIAEVRRKVDEPTEGVYTDEAIQAMLDAVDNDANAVVADIWEEKAGQAQVNFDFSADGGRFDRNQVFEARMKLSRFYRGKTRARNNVLLSKLDPLVESDE